LKRDAKGRLIRVMALLVVLALALIGMLALQNGPWTHSPIIKNGQSLIAGMILSRVDLVSMPEGRGLSPSVPLPPMKIRALEKGDIDIVSASNLAHLGKQPQGERFVIVTIEPLDLIGKGTAEQRRIIEGVDNLAILGKIDAIVEATASDALRAGEWGKRGTIRLRAAGVIRCVLFDGGHHIDSLPLAPDILIVPVTEYKGEAHAAHWFTRDAVPLRVLTRTLRDSGIESAIALFPRAGIPVKNRDGMAWLAAQSVRKAIETERAGEHTRDKSTPALDPAVSKTGYPVTEGRFISLSVDCENGGTNMVKPRILSELRGKIRPVGRNSAGTENVYLCVTIGNSCFPYRSKDAGFNRRELEAYLDKRMPYNITVLSEPLSVWDIYLARLGF
jgi:hypothetical protein